MEENSNTNSTTDTIIQTINTIFENLFSSIDNSLYSVLDNITFITSGILNDKYFAKIFGTATTDGILLIANSLLIGFLIYYALRNLLANFTYVQIESPVQFVLKMIIFGICMNSSYFIVGQVIDIMSNISLAIKEIGENLFSKNIGFSELITSINNTLSVDTSSINIFSIDGLIKATLTISLFNLVFSYSLRYIMIKVFILISPFAFLALSQNSTAWFFKAWIRNFFSLLFIQIIVALVLLILFSMDYSSNNLLVKFLYIGGIYALIRVNTFVREFIGGVSTNVQSGINGLFNFRK